MNRFIRKFPRNFRTLGIWIDPPLNWFKWFLYQNLFGLLSFSFPHHNHSLRNKLTTHLQTHHSSTNSPLIHLSPPSSSIGISITVLPHQCGRRSHRKYHLYPFVLGEYLSLSISWVSLFYSNTWDALPLLWVDLSHKHENGTILQRNRTTQI